MDREGVVGEKGAVGAARLGAWEQGAARQSHAKSAVEGAPQVELDLHSVLPETAAGVQRPSATAVCLDFGEVTTLCNSFSSRTSFISTR